jgi:hypothetical protein
MCDGCCPVKLQVFAVARRGLAGNSEGLLSKNLDYTHNARITSTWRVGRQSETWSLCVSGVESDQRLTAEWFVTPEESRDAARAPKCFVYIGGSRSKTRRTTFAVNRGVSMVASFTFLDKKTSPRLGLLILHGAPRGNRRPWRGETNTQLRRTALQIFLRKIFSKLSEVALRRESTKLDRACQRVNFPRNRLLASVVESLSQTQWLNLFGSGSGTSNSADCSR